MGDEVSTLIGRMRDNICNYFLNLDEEKLNPTSKQAVGNLRWVFDILGTSSHQGADFHHNENDIITRFGI